MVRLLTLSGLILLLAAPTASAGVREKILRECQDGRISGNYTPAQLRDARKHIPTDIDEYSDCRDVLARASLGRPPAAVRSAAAAARAARGRARRRAVERLRRPPLAANNPAEQEALAEARSPTAREHQSSAARSLIPGATGLSADRRATSSPRPCSSP